MRTQYYIMRLGYDPCGGEVWGRLPQSKLKLIPTSARLSCRIFKTPFRLQAWKQYSDEKLLARQTPDHVLLKTNGYTPYHERETTRLERRTLISW